MLFRSVEQEREGEMESVVLTFLGFSRVGGSSTAASTSLAEIHVS